MECSRDALQPLAARQIFFGQVFDLRRWGLGCWNRIAPLETIFDPDLLRLFQISQRFLRCSPVSAQSGEFVNASDVLALLVAVENHGVRQVQIIFEVWHGFGAGAPGAPGE